MQRNTLSEEEKTTAELVYIEFKTAVRTRVMDIKQ